MVFYMFKVDIFNYINDGIDSLGIKCINLNKFVGRELEDKTLLKVATVFHKFCVSGFWSILIYIVKGSTQVIF